MTDAPIATEPPALLDAMFAMLRRRVGLVDGDRVTGYRERSYNIGYCETCSDLVTDVRIYYERADGRSGHYQVEYTGLAELIRELTDDPEQRGTWIERATHETPDERSDRWSVHGFDEEERP